MQKLKNILHRLVGSHKAKNRENIQKRITEVQSQQLVMIQAILADIGAFRKERLALRQDWAKVSQDVINAIEGQNPEISPSTVTDLQRQIRSVEREYNSFKDWELTRLLSQQKREIEKEIREMKKEIREDVKWDTRREIEKKLPFQGDWSLVWFVNYLIIVFLVLVFSVFISGKMLGVSIREFKQQIEERLTIIESAPKLESSMGEGDRNE